MAQAIGAVGIGSSLAGGILGAYGAESSGADQQKMYNYQAQVAKINASIDKQNEEYALNFGEQQSVIEGMKGGEQFGAIRNAQGASNIDVNSGSAADVQASQRKITSMDLTQIRSNAAKTAYDFDVKSAMDLNQADLDTMAGANARKAGDINAISSILGSVSSVSSKWLQGSQVGLWGGNTNNPATVKNGTF